MLHQAANPSRQANRLWSPCSVPSSLGVKPTRLPRSSAERFPRHCKYAVDCDGAGRLIIRAAGSDGEARWHSSIGQTDGPWTVFDPRLPAARLGTAATTPGPDVL